MQWRKLQLNRLPLNGGRAAGGLAGLIRAALFFEKPGRPAGQPTMYLASLIHFWGYIIGIGILLDVFSLFWHVFSLLWVICSLSWVVFSLLCVVLSFKRGSCLDLNKVVAQPSCSWCKHGNRHTVWPRSRSPRHTGHSWPNPFSK